MNNTDRYFANLLSEGYRQISQSVRDGSRTETEANEARVILEERINREQNP